MRLHEHANAATVNAHAGRIGVESELGSGAVAQLLRFLARGSNERFPEFRQGEDDNGGLG